MLRLKKPITVLVLFCAVTALQPGVLAAVPESLVPVGDTVGIEIGCGGVMVVGLSDVETSDSCLRPAESAGMLMGDIIKSINGREIGTAADFMSAAANMDGSAVEIMVERDGKSIEFHVSPALNRDGVYQLGMWLRDGVSGIGTLTYYDPASGSFGALGHGINEQDSGELVGLDSGELYPAEVVDVKKGAVGTPGELCGKIASDDVIGVIEKNTAYGIFGKLDSVPGGEPLPLASESEIILGPASVLSNVQGEEIREYEVEISRIYRNSKDGRSLMLKINDPELLSVTGGIVQGMSGSPIIQNGKLVGAVTHVLVNDPERGYGISIENMLNAAA